MSEHKEEMAEVLINSHNFDDIIYQGQVLKKETPMILYIRTECITIISCIKSSTNKSENEKSYNYSDVLGAKCKEKSTKSFKISLFLKNPQNNRRTLKVKSLHST